MWSFPSLTEPAASADAPGAWAGEAVPAPPAPPAPPVEEAWTAPSLPSLPAPSNGGGSWTPPVPEPPAPVTGAANPGPTRTWFEDLWSTSSSESPESEARPAAAAASPGSLAEPAAHPAFPDEVPEPTASGRTYDADVAAYSGTNGAAASLADPRCLGPADRRVRRPGAGRRAGERVGVHRRRALAGRPRRSW